MPTAADLSAVLSAVKPKERTDQYKILAALYCLNSSGAPVTARQVEDLLSLNLGARIPKNVSSSLRAYSAYVRVAEKGPPLRWALTGTGLEKLRALSGLELSSNASDDQYGADVGIVCALQHPEFEAVINAGGGLAKWRDVSSARYAHLYRETKIQSANGKELTVVGTTATSMGLTAASIVTTQLILQFKPRLVVMIGIAAGTHDGGKQFGDILVADPSVDYNSGKVVDVGGIRDFLPDPYPIGLNPRLRSILQKYRGSHAVFETIKAGWKGPVPDPSNRLHLGPLGAADQVIDDPQRVIEIQRNWRKLIGVEMETYGVYRACYEAPDPKPRFVSFKAVCDFAAQKTDSWQTYAAYTAAEFAFRFIKTEWEGLWPKP